MNNKCPITGKFCEHYKFYKITDLDKGKVNNFNVCESCVDKLDLIKELKDIKEDICEFCGMTLQELAKSGHMGCAKCYNKFENPLIFSLEKLQKIPIKEPKELKHVGRVPYSWKKKKAQENPPEDFLKELNNKLKEYCSEEHYEKASEIKNFIIAFESYVENYKENLSDEEQLILIREQMTEFILNFRESLEEER